MDTTPEGRGREKSHSISHQKVSKDMTAQDELALVDKSKHILQLRDKRL